MNKTLKHIIGLFTTLFLVMSGIDLFIEGIEINVQYNLLISLIATGIVSLYGGILNLWTNKQRHL